MASTILAGNRGDHVDPFGNIVPDLGEALGCPLLQGATAFFGFDECKDDFTNYFYCDETADDVQISLAMVYTNALGGGHIKGDEGTYDITAATEIYGDIWVEGSGINATILLLSANINIFEYTATDTLYFFSLSELKLHGGNNTGSGLYVQAGGGGSLNDVTLQRVFIVSFDGDGFYSEDCWGWRLINVVSEFNTGNGGYFTTTDKGLHIVASKFLSNDTRGLYINASAPQITTSEFGGNGTHGLQLVGCLDGSLINSKLNNNSQNTINTSSGLQISGSGSRIKIVANNFDGNNQEKYGITILNASCLDNILDANTFIDHVTAPIADLGTNTRLPFKTFQFTEVTGGSATKQLTSPVGCYVFDAGATAILWGEIPPGARQIVRLKIQAVAKDAPAAGGGHMHCEFTFNAGAANVAYNTANKSWNLADHDSEEADYVADDVVNWIIEDGDVGDELANLAGRDSFEMLAIYESEDSPDGETDAKFRTLTVQYV